tara:strand:- start:323 stop:895 length:573 start_codon:yes stop_codon:yes gene_type:complete
MKIICTILLINIIFCKSDPEIASQTSIFPIYNSINTKPAIFIGSNSKNNNAIFAIKFFPTLNLSTGGMLALAKDNNDLYINYKFDMGYIPNWRLFDFSENIIQIGIERHRFSKMGGFRWFNLSFIQSIKLKYININIGWNKILTKKWERNSVLIASNIKLIDNIFFQLGYNSFFNPKFNFSPFILLNITI